MGQSRGWWWAVVLVPMASQARGWTVDDDRAQCPRAEFTRIQDAVDAAKPGDLIHVCAGLYGEAVVVPRSLALEGTGPVSQARSGNPAAESVVRPPEGMAAFTFTGSRIHLKAFTLWGKGRPSNGEGVIATAAGSGHVIEGNAIWNFNQGLAIASNNRSGISIVRNAIARGELGIFLLKVHGASIQQGHFTELLVAIQANDSRQLEVSESTFETSKPGPAIHLLRADHAIVRKNQVLRGGDTGFDIAQSDHVTVVDNRIQDVARSAGISVRESTRCEIRENQIENVNFASGTAQYGLVLVTTSDTLVEDNQVSRVVGTGIGVAFSSSKVRLKANITHDNTGEGLAVTGSTGNHLTENLAFRNGGADIRDDDRGANDWTRNWCPTDVPSGTICMREGRP